MSSITVVYLFRKGEDVAWVLRFANAVRQFPSGCPAHWHFYLKGFDDDSCVRLEAVERAFQQVAEAALDGMDGAGEMRVFRIPDGGWDLGTYREAVEHVKTEHVLFLNAHSEPLAENWLRHYVIALETHALVGATGSHEGVPDQRVPFPNPHIRTNAFAMPVKVLRTLAWPIPKTKDDAHRLECGPWSITRQVLERGLLAGVVNRRGNIFGVESANTLRGSGTFRWANQVDLLVADNRTRAYDASDEDTKDFLERLAWGETQSPDKVPPTIILPSFRREQDPRTWDDLHLCLASAAYYAPECPVLVGWDGPLSPVREGSPCPGQTTFEERPKGLSGPGAYNWCAERAKTRHLVLMNDDAVFHPDTLSRLVEDWNGLRLRGALVGFLGCRSNFVAGEANIRHPNGGSRTGVDYTSEQVVLGVSTVYPVCAMIARSTYLNAGGFQPEINWYADNLLCFDLAAQGYQHFVSRAYVHHVGMRGTRAEANRSMAEENDRSLTWLKANRPDYYAQLHG